MALPRGRITITEAAEIVSGYSRAGTPNPAGVLDVPKGWTHSARRPELTEARVHLREWIASGKLKLRAIGGVHGRDVVIPPLEFTQIPLLKSLAVGDLTGLRPSHPLYPRYQGLFGRDIYRVELGVDERQVHRLARSTVLRLRRRPQSTSRRGRPSLDSKVDPAIREIVLSRKWTADKTQKELARQLCRKLKESVSQTTVTRRLDAVFENTGDRRFQRIRREAEDG